MDKNLLLAAAIAWVIWPSTVDAALPSIEGTEPKLWSEFSVVYAHVASVAKVGASRVAVTLCVDATLTGGFDAAAQSLLHTELSYAEMSSVREAPKANSHVIAVLYLRPGDDRYTITSAIVRFMPGEASIVEVEGFDDPKVAAVISRLRALRAATQKDLGPPKENVLTDSLDMKLVRIPAGEFTMGSPDSDKEALDREKPRHRVRITKPFYLGMHEVTQEQYERLMGENPSRFKGDPERPVENVTWEDAVEFCRKLSEKEGVTYRLPTEAEWEYACRAGSKQVYPFDNYPIDLGEYAYWGRNSKDTTHRVGLKKPNAWGLYDMLGNVSEWCADWYRDDYYAISPVDDPVGAYSRNWRVVRGGSSYFVEPPPNYRCAQRNFSAPTDHNAYRGFRVVRVLTPREARNADKFN